MALIYSLTFIHYFSIIINNKSNRCNYLAIKAPVHKETKNSAITIIYKGNSMETKKRTLECRRGFISMLSGIFSGLLLARPVRVQATKSEIKKFLWNIETDILERSRPLKHPSITHKTQGSTIRLYKEQKGELRPMCVMNQAGKIVLDWCNGKNTPRDIARLLQQHYQVTADEAYFDCLTFLAHLKKKGAIEI